MGCCVSFVCLPVMLDSIDKTILIGIIIIAMIVETSPLEEFEIALWIGITVRAALGVNPNWRNDCDSSSEVKRRFGKDVPRTNLDIVLIRCSKANGSYLSQIWFSTTKSRALDKGSSAPKLSVRVDPS